MKKIILPVLVLALAVGLFAVWRLTRSEATRPAVADEVSKSPSVSETTAGTLLTALDRSDTSAAEAERQGLPASASAERGLETWDIARSVWVEGVVRPPAGCADEGPIEVFATSEPADADDLARMLASERVPATLLSRRPVGPEGAFKIPFPPDMKTGQLSVRGRYLYLPASLAVDLKGSLRTVALEPRCGTWITGTIRLPAESPVASSELDGLEVVLRTAAQNLNGPVAGMRGFRRKTKVASLAFEFRAVPAESDCVLEVEPSKLAAATLEIEKPPAGRENPVRIDLLRGGSIRGTVRDAEGQPVADAEVEAALPGQWFGFDNREVRSGKSAADGTFELQAVAPGGLVLRASREGFLQSERAKVDLQDGGFATAVELVLTLGNSVTGTVAWADGKPAASVAVEASFDRSQLFGMGAFNAARGANGKAVTGAQGSFTISGLGKGPFTLQTKAPPPAGLPAEKADEKPDGKTSDGDSGSVPGDNGELKPESGKKATWWRARADGVQPGASAVALVLRAPAGISGRVVDEKGQPVAKFRIEAVRQGKGPMGSFGEEESKQSFDDDQGRFLVTGLIEGTWNFFAVADGFGLPEAIPVAVPRTEGEPELSIALEHSASVAGVVKSPGGQLVAGATVAVDTGEPSWKGILQSGPKPPKATSAADGTYLLDGLRSGKFRVSASSKEYAKSLPIEVELATGEHRTDLEIALREGGVLTGEVFADGGRPATGMFVQAVQTKDFESQMSFTGSKGEFRIEHLVPGNWQVIAMPSRGEPGGTAGAEESKEGADGAMEMVSKMKMTIATINEGEETHVVLGAPPKDPVDVHGTVTHSGEPCAGSMVSFVPEGKEPLKSMKSCQVGKDGAYAVKLDAPGHYAISVQQLAGGMAQQSTIEFARDIPETKDHRLDFAMPTARISGRVTGPDGAPAAGARISLHPESPVEAGTMWGGQYHEGVTDADGRFDVKMLRAGVYALSSGGMTFGGLMGEESAFGREIRGGIKLSDGEWMRDVDFRLKKAGTLEVSVVDAGGAPVPEASVFARDASGRLVDGLSMIATDASGKARYQGLGPGNYTIVARKDLLASTDSARAKLDEGGRAEVQVALQPGTILIVTCVGEESKPVQAAISVQDGDGREVGAMISLSEAMKMFSENGFSTTERRIGPLPQGKYTVRATGPDGKLVTKPVNLTGQAERKLTLHFD